MDRRTVYQGQIRLETDLLHAQQFGTVALAKLASGVLGPTTIVNGLTCVPTSPASLNVQMTKGEVYQLEPLEATSWSSLPSDTSDIILKRPASTHMALARSELRQAPPTRISL
jgi:hypothetical protein